jgi:hypothetical protein
VDGVFEFLIEPGFERGLARFIGRIGEVMVIRAALLAEIPRNGALPLSYRQSRADRVTESS